MTLRLLIRRTIAVIAVAATSTGSRLGAVRVQEQPADSALERVLRTPDTLAMQAHVRFLAGDLLRGRAPGTPGADIAAAYVAARFETLGLIPAGDDGGYLQRVRLVGATPRASLVIGAQRQTAALEPGRDFVVWPTAPEASTIVDGDLVFVGFGIRADEWGWDDFGDEPLTGRILLIRVNDPGIGDSTRFEGQRLTAYGHWSYKLEQAARMGAAGAILVHSDEGAGAHWTATVNARAGEVLLEDGRRTTSLRFGAWVSESAARRLIESTGRDYDVLMRRSEAPDFRPIPLEAHVVMRMQSDLRPVETANVVAVLPGSGADPEEAVVLTAHYDHLGVRRPLGADSIYNGAEDAAGVAALMEAAAALTTAGVPRRRSIVFVVTSASEAGLLGAAAYVRNPVIPLQRTAAAMAFDRLNLRGATDDVAALGSEWSSLRETLARAARAEGLRLADDSPAEPGAFYHSDVRSLAEAGVPSVLVRGGGAFRGRSPDWGAQEARRYLDARYHQPSDELRRDVRWEGALQQVRLILRVMLGLAGGTEYPTWNDAAPYRDVGERLRLMRLRGGGL